EPVEIPAQELRQKRVQAPAVEDRMALGEGQVEGVAVARMEGEPDQRRPGEVERARLLRGDEIVERPLLVARRESGQVQDGEQDADRAVHPLERLRAAAEVERGAQDRVA